MTAPRLSNATVVLDRPERAGIVHLGLGAFHRAHQAWYTAGAGDAHAWGIVAFTGRSAQAAETLAAQDGLYTLIERSDSDRLRVIGQLLRAYPGDHLERWAATLNDPDVGVLTTTVTESGYGLDAAGRPLASVALDADLARLRETDGHGVAAEPTTVLGRIVAGLAERRRAIDRGLSVVPCDNIPGNGAWLERGVLTAAERIDPTLGAWIRENVAFISTSVDRITPATIDADRRQVEEALGVVDLAPVVTERFASWVLQGAFPAGRPAWEDAGAQFVDDVEPFERRKLWLLNGAHTALALVGPRFGATTIAEAMEIPECRLLVERLWDAAERHLPPGLELTAYRAELVTRFTEPRIRHLLSQIAQDTPRKLQVRIVPIALAERAAGHDAEAPAAVVAAWIAAVMSGALSDPIALPAADGEDRDRDPVRALVGALDPRLADDSAFIAEVRNHTKGHTS